MAHSTIFVAAYPQRVLFYTVAYNIHTHVGCILDRSEKTIFPKSKMPHTEKVVVPGPKHGKKIWMKYEVIFRLRIWPKVYNGKSHSRKVNFNENVPVATSK